MDMEKLYYVSRKLRVWVEQSVVPAHVSAKFPLYHWMVLRDIVETPNTTVQEISKRLSMAQSMVSGAVSKLKEQGYVDARPDPEDRRKVRLFPSPVVSEWVRAHVSRDAVDVLAPLLEELDEQQKACLLRTLDILYDKFKRLEQSTAGPGGKAE